MPDDAQDDLRTGSTSSIDPETGEQRVTQFTYRPPRPPSPMEAMLPQIQSAYQNLPLADAEKAVAAAIQYQGLRGYQQALQSGESADKALAKYAPMMFYKKESAIGSAAKALNPPTFTRVPGVEGGPAVWTAPGQAPRFEPRGLQPSATIQNVDEVQKTEQMAQAAEQSGNAALAKQYRDRAILLREQMKGQQIVMGYDDQGRPIFQIGKGAAPTVATASRAQQKLQKYENATEIINRLQSGLETGHVGLAGMAGEYLWDRGLVQLANLMGDETAQANPERVNSRAGLIMLRESLMREISDDPRFSNLDREEISKALPSSGAFESLSDAKQKLSTVREIMSKRAKVYAGSINAPTPLWSMTPDEIKAQYKAGKIDRKAAIDALSRYH